MSELIIKVEWYSPVEISYNGYRIMSQEDWNQLQELIKSDTQVPYTNTPKWWEESFPASELSDAFSIFSGPGAEHPGFGAPMTEEEHQNTLKSFRKLFPGGDVGDTSIIDSVFDAELNSGDGAIQALELGSVFKFRTESSNLGGLAVVLSVSGNSGAYCCERSKSQANQRGRWTMGVNLKTLPKAFFFFVSIG